MQYLLHSKNQHIWAITKVSFHGDVSTICSKNFVNFLVKTLKIICMYSAWSAARKICWELNGQWWIRVHYKRSRTVCYCPIISCKFLLTARIGSVSVDFIPICVWMTWTYFFAQSFLWHPCLKSTFAKSNFEYCMYSGVWNIGVALYIIKFWENT